MVNTLADMEKARKSTNDHMKENEIKKQKTWSGL